MEASPVLTPSLRVVAPLDSLVLASSSWRAVRRLQLLGHVRETALANDPHGRADECIMLRSARCRVDIFSVDEMRGVDLREPHRAALRTMTVADVAERVDQRHQCQVSFAVGADGSELVMALPLVMFEDLYENCRAQSTNAEAGLAIDVFDLALGDAAKAASPSVEEFLAAIERSAQAPSWRALHAHRVELELGALRRVDTAHRSR